MNVCEPVIAALEPMGQTSVIDTHEMQDGRIQIMGMNGILYHVVTIIVRRAICQAAFQSPTCHPEAIATAMLIAAEIRTAEISLRVNRSAKLPAPNDKRIVEQTTPLEILNKRGGRLIDIVALFRQVAADADVLIPSAMHELHESTTAFHKASRQKTVSCETSIFPRLIQAVQPEGFGGFPGQIG